MQAGKTGVLNTLLRLVFKNVKQLNIKPDRVFVITGMNDLSWAKQTKARLPHDARSGVAHNGALGKTVLALKALAEHDEAGWFRNVLVVVDESHIATNMRNRLNMQVYNEMAQLCPPDLWVTRNIRVLTISATDPAKITAMKQGVPSQVVVLNTTAAYQSVKTLKDANRLRNAEDFGDGVAELIRAAKEFPEPLYHFKRCKGGNNSELVEAQLLKDDPGCCVIQYDSKNHPTIEAPDGSVSIMDINDILAEAPAVRTYILLKNMFYAAKTMDDAHVGVLYDRVGGKDDTNLQSLLGRACGYGKSKRTIVYTSRQTVLNYLGFWQQVIQGVPVPITDRTVEQLAKKMNGIQVLSGPDNQHTLQTADTHAAPGYISTNVENTVAPKRVRKVLNEANFIAVWTEWSTLAEAKIMHKFNTPRVDNNGFYMCAPRGKSGVQRYDAVKRFDGGKATAMFANPKELPVGESSYRLYVGYRNTADLSSAVFFVKQLTRIRAD